MKRSILVLGLLFVATQSNCGVFDDAMGFLKKTASGLFDQGKKYLADNSGKILATVKEKAGELVQQGIGMAKEKGMELVKQGAGMAKEKAASLFGKSTDLKSSEDVKSAVTQAQVTGTTMDEAQMLVLNTASVEADKETKELNAQAQNIVATTKGLTPAEQKIILQEAQNLAIQNRADLVKQANASIAQKKMNLEVQFMQNMVRVHLLSKKYTCDSCGSSNCRCE